MLETLAAFSAGVRTQLVEAGDGKTVYVCQSAGDGRDAVFVVRDGELPRATSLTAGAAAAALGLSGPNTRGEIEGLAPLPGGKLAFYFSGTAGREAASGVGVFDPRDGSIRVRAADGELARVAGFTGTISLLRGTLVRTGSRLILWLNGVAGSTFLSFDAERLAGTGDVVLTKPFARLTLDDTPLQLPAAAWLSAGGPETLCLTLPTLAKVYVIDRDGRAEPQGDYVGRPALTTPPVFQSGTEPTVFFADGEVPSDSAGVSFDALAGLPLPLLIRPGSPPHAREDFHGPPAFPTYALHFTALVPFGSDLVGYDFTSGKVMRVIAENAPR